MIERAGVVEVQAFTDFAAFNTRDLGQFYLPDILSPLPGSNMRSLAIDRERDLLFMGTQRAAARLSVGRLRAPVPEDLTFTLYPNPVRNGQDALYVADFPGTADLKIYNLLGVLLHTSRDIEAGEAAWDLRTLSDNEVASGLYVVRLEQNGRVALRTLAVEK